MRLLNILKIEGASVPIKAKSPMHMLPILLLTAVLAPRVALAQHDGGRMGGGGWMGGQIKKKGCTMYFFHVIIDSFVE